jgi:endonuclease/exonuclease/phosphatase family metal-dependent hydrolase
MALRAKQDALASLRPDIAILQEVSESDASQHAQHTWVGNNAHKGLAVIACNDFTVSVHPLHDPRIEFVLPIEVKGPADFSLVAVWAMHGRAANRIQERPNRWQVLQAIETYEPLLRSGRCVVAGDFNNAVVWDTPGKASNHSIVVQTLGDLGLISAYHVRFEADQGKEAHPTLFWMRHPDARYHIDYVWLPRAWQPGLRSVEIGEYATWVQSGLSDHVPIAVELDNEVISPNPTTREVRS